MNRSIVTGILILWTSLALAQECLDLVGSSPYGWAEDVAVEGDVAAFGNGRALQIIDVSDPTVPEVDGEAVFTYLVDVVEVANDSAFVGTTRDLEVLDISDPTQPVILGGIDGFRVSQLAYEGDHLYGVSDHSLVVVEVSSPASPFIVGQLEWPDFYPRDLVVAGNTAYVIVEGSLRVVDLSDPTAPTEITSIEFGTDREARRLTVEGDFAYVVVVGPHPLTWKLVVVDIETPSMPTIGIEIDAAIGVTDIDTNGILLVSSSASGVDVYDMSSPASPVWVGEEPIECFYSLGAVAAADGSVLVTCEVTGLKILDVTVPSTPTMVSTVDAPGSVEDATVDGETLLIAADTNGLRVVDVGDPAQPEELGLTEVLPQAFGIASLGDIAYASGYRLATIDLADPAAPVVLGYEPGAPGNWITIEGDRGYVVDRWGGVVRIVDLSFPAVPFVLGSTNLPSGRWEWPVVIDDHLIVRNTVNDSSVAIIDAGDPMSPVEVASIDVWSGFGGLATNGSWLLIPDIIDGLEPAIRVFDMRDPAVPVEAAPYHPVGGGVDVIGVSGAVAYLSVMDFPPTQTGAIEAVNFADPRDPVLMGLIDHPGNVTSFTKRIAFGLGEVYLFGRESGFDSFTLCRGPLFADGFESGDTSVWSSAVP